MYQGWCNLNDAQGNAELFGQKDQDDWAKHSEEAHGINVLVNLLPGSMWTAGFMVLSKGQDQNLYKSWVGCFIIFLEQQLCTKQQDWPQALIQTHLSAFLCQSSLCSCWNMDAFFFSESMPGEMVSSNPNKTSCHQWNAGGWAAKACSQNALLLLSSNILILWPNTNCHIMQMLLELMATCLVLRQECVLFQELRVPKFKNWAKYFKYGLISNVLYSCKISALNQLYDGFIHWLYLHPQSAYKY